MYESPSTTAVVDPVQERGVHGASHPALRDQSVG